MTWHLSRLAVLDLETTAPNPEDARIVTACRGAVGGGLPTEVTQRVVNPGVPIPAGAIEVHGITDEIAQRDGCEPALAAQELLDWLGGVWAAGLPVIAYNASYDLTVIDREARRHLGLTLVIGGPVVDPFVIDRQVDKYRKGKRTLSAAVAHYGVRLDGAHDATEDALAAARVAYRIGQQFPEIAGMDLWALHDAQAGWHAERQRDFAAYRQRIGEPLDDISGEWPLRGVPVEVSG